MQAEAALQSDTASPWPWGISGLVVQLVELAVPADPAAAAAGLRGAAGCGCAGRWGKMAAEQGMRVVGPRPGAGLGRVIRALLLLLCFAARGGALYFHIGETEKKCFIEEIPDETMVIGAGRRGSRDRDLPRSWGGGAGRPPGADSTPPGASLTRVRPTPLQETTGRSCMTSSGRSTSRPPPGWACSWR